MSPGFKRFIRSLSHPISKSFAFGGSNGTLCWTDLKDFERPLMGVGQPEGFDQWVVGGIVCVNHDAVSITPPKPESYKASYKPAQRVQTTQPILKGYSY